MELGGGVCCGNPGGNLGGWVAGDGKDTDTDGQHLS